MKKNYPLKEKTLYVTNRDDWRAWLEKYHAKKEEIWLTLYKKHADRPSISYDEAVEESLCFGWIDSLVKKVDEERYIQKFSPRRKNSTWSARNKKRVEDMIQQGRMRAAGLEKIEKAKRDGSWNALDSLQKPGRIPPDLKKALSTDENILVRFRKLTPTAKKQFIWWIESAKREETRKKRIAMTLQLVSKRKTLSDHYYGR